MIAKTSLTNRLIPTGSTISGMKRLRGIVHKSTKIGCTDNSVETREMGPWLFASVTRKSAAKFSHSATRTKPNDGNWCQNIMVAKFSLKYCLTLVDVKSI